MAKHGREHVQGMLAATPSLETPAGRSAFASCARGFAALLRSHIAKENDVLFVMADRLLDASGDAALCAAFSVREAEARKLCGEKAQHERALADLAQRWT